ncbi:hypothetical protein SAMN05216386_0837 [Nitrosospira briensis]|uniref:Uncharacterized protein n=1 Tax=Nitrosospira briensis TaxID=35799 RepID=A0A1I4YQT2_9PROT|nr:hypothetical protein [Nitrosospira briensis]SFN40371.1 hypothetical protein SAMN05216386_0837 [Nitrosospira briensis]
MWQGKRTKMYRHTKTFIFFCIIGLGLISSCVMKTTTQPAGPDNGSTINLEKITYFDIAHAYHGLLLDRQFREIKLSKAVIEQLQDSMIQSLTAMPEVSTEESDAKPYKQHRKTKPPLEKSYVKKVLSGFKFSDDQRILTKSLLIQKGIDVALPDEKLAYQWRFDLIHERSLDFLQLDLRNLDIDFSRYLNNYIDPRILAALLGSLRIDNFVETGYMRTCRSNSVPIPPNWPDSGWVNRGTLPSEYAFAGSPSNPNSEVWTYVAPGNAGLCYALPRTNTSGSVGLLGIICQSQTTGKACFWDNLNATTGRRITGRGIRLQINQLKDGSNLAENCTECHRGFNAFVVHPHTPLGSPTNRDPSVRYTPIGQSTWANPPAFSELGAGACSGCHEIAEPTPRYCGILRQAADKTMPSAATPAGWNRPTAAYAAHISYLKTRCP